VALNCAAIQTDIIPRNSKVQVYLGIGKDESERMFLIEESDVNFSMTHFNWVISVSNNDESMAIQTPYSPDEVFIDLNKPSPSLGSSAIEGNAQWKKKPIAKVVGTTPDKTSLTRITGHVHYNSNNTISLLQPGRYDESKSGSVDYTFFGDFEVVYSTNPDHYEFHRLNESFMSAISNSLDTIQQRSRSTIQQNRLDRLLVFPLNLLLFPPKLILRKCQSRRFILLRHRM
ncbi:hypothetical protein PENTCL1PPCAC_2766, partial [Pristionchus entomophagus]